LALWTDEPSGPIGCQDTFAPIFCHRTRRERVIRSDPDWIAMTRSADELLFSVTRPTDIQSDMFYDYPPMWNPTQMQDGCVKATALLVSGKA